jgi:hypothetical protein
VELHSDRRGFLRSTALALGGLESYFLFEEEVNDSPYQAMGKLYEQVGESLEPGEPVPEEVKDLMFLPDDLTEYIVPEQTRDVYLADMRDFTYERDTMDFKTPQEFIEDESGDCEDYAVAVASWKRRWGEDAMVYLGTLKGEAHWVAEANGYIYSFKNDFNLDDWRAWMEFGPTTPLQGYTGRHL